MRYFKTKDLKKWARKEHITDVHLMQVYAEFIEGLYEADLGNGLFKKRIGLGNRGKMVVAVSSYFTRLMMLSCFAWAIANLKKTTSPKKKKIT